MSFKFFFEILFKYDEVDGYNFSCGLMDNHLNHMTKCLFATIKCEHLLVGIIASIKLQMLI